MMHLLEQAHQIIWGPYTLLIFLGVGIFFTIKCRFFQFLGFHYWWKHTAGTLFRGKKGYEKKGMTQFQSVCMALAATVGTGNIAGVATALTAGGPGAIFWMWVSAFIGMMTAYSETMLGIQYRLREKGGSYLCGPFVYMERGLGMKGMSLCYSFLCMMGSLSMGSMVQANSAVSTMSYTWGIPSVAGGLAFTGLLFLVAWGGIRRIGAVAERLVPAASGIYLFFSMAVILSCMGKLPAVFGEMLSAAFRPEAAAGGIWGYAVSRSVRYGVSRGVFSNEAGLGTLAVLHGGAEDTTPQEQGMWAMFEVFFDTVILCTMTAVVILCTWGLHPEKAPCTGAALAGWCFEKGLGALGGHLISGSMAVFAFATVMAWFYLGRQAASYFAGGLGIGDRGRDIFTSKIYPILYLAAVFVGSQLKLEAVWLLADLWNGMMAFPNLTALLFLAGKVTLPKDYTE